MIGLLETKRTVRFLVVKRSGTKTHNIKSDEAYGPITKATGIAASTL